MVDHSNERGRSGESTRLAPAEPPCGEAGPRIANDSLFVVHSNQSALLGKRFVLAETPVLIGRDEVNHITLLDDLVSRRHARLERCPTGWVLAEEGSTNGTFLNDHPVHVNTPLNSGDLIKIGATVLKFLSGADPEAQYHEEIYRLTIIDGLTQIHNRRFIQETLERETARCHRYERDVSLLLLDVDHFKHINDTHGHLAGDHVLKELARVIRARLRSHDVFGRYGGEEFAVILPETPIEFAIALAEALVRKVSAHSFQFKDTIIPVTISIGVAACDNNDLSISDLIKRCDLKLYEAKHKGRNRVGA